MNEPTPFRLELWFPDGTMTCATGPLTLEALDSAYQVTRAEAERRIALVMD